MPSACREDGALHKHRSIEPRTQFGPIDGPDPDAMARLDPNTRRSDEANRLRFHGDDHGGRAEENPSHDLHRVAPRSNWHSQFVGQTCRRLYIAAFDEGYAEAEKQNGLDYR